MKAKIRKLEIKHYSSPDISNLWAWEPESNKVFYLLEMEIGLSDEAKADIYSIFIATSEGISSLENNKKILNKAYKLILLEKYSWNLVMDILNEILVNVDTRNSFSISGDLNRSFYWEYGAMN